MQRRLRGGVGRGFRAAKRGQGMGDRAVKLGLRLAAVVVVEVVVVEAVRC